MKKSKYSDSQIMAILEQAKAGTPVPKLCRETTMRVRPYISHNAKPKYADSLINIFAFNLLAGKVGERTAA
ncbi:hypothetical protein QWI17_16920 [Gilvimarinus sp. SDUM040013]|uniref:Transposase n=1 Tax=Gilvimarinus gilvus TaxID=3058038 RepID=A0ABU4S6K5_9GAMM|nr:hypothetical protein [Gilvimarinus sp. SDUM040013]MDO3387527.1 hypothetical protein [Gilvimarinus sp. SDUM040013]MDX6851543.1 hypothetical protein [Gilvimarinus sp. SDUM040013]